MCGVSFSGDFFGVLDDGGGGGRGGFPFGVLFFSSSMFYVCCFFLSMIGCLFVQLIDAGTNGQVICIWREEEEEEKPTSGN